MNTTIWVLTLCVSVWGGALCRGAAQTWEYRSETACYKAMDDAKNQAKETLKGKEYIFICSLKL